MPKFEKGKSGNPGGKPVHARNRVTTTFLNALAEDFERHGKKAIVETRTQHPEKYVAIVAGLLPKEFVIEKPFDGLSDEELAAIIAQLRELTGRAGEGGTGDGAPTRH